ncbi:MAG: WecB/TagA/CpsF family glycosyltransferase [Chloroflexota bacterium]
MKIPSTVSILDVNIHCVDFEQTLALIAGWIEDARHRGALHQDAENSPGEVAQICTVNPEFIMEARRNPGFAAVLRRASLCVADGVGVVWAARRQGVHLRERVTGSDGIYRIAERAAHPQHQWHLYLLGAAPGVAEEAAQRLCQQYDGLQIVGAYGGNPTPDEWPEIARRLQVAQPDMVLVAYGHPKQDFWIDRYRAELSELSIHVAIGVGGAFDFVAGRVIRAPKWIQRLGLEWLYRLLQEPWRWRRMMALPQFVWLVLTDG